jgi:hypothetical protein
MSKVKIQGNASGTGVLTISAPNTSTDRTITLPDSTGTILDNTSTLDATKLSGNLPAISAASLTNVPKDVTVGGRKNIIINGNMRVAQRGTSFTDPASGAFTLDRWKSGVHTSTAAANYTQEADAPTAAQAGTNFVNCLKNTCTTTDTSTAATIRYYTKYQLEGYDIAPAGFGQAGVRYMTLSFWHKHTKTGINSFGIVSGDNGRHYVAEYTQTTSDTWEKATHTFPVDTTGTWATDNSKALNLYFATHIGSNYHGTANTWGTGQAYGTANQVNNYDSTSNSMRFTGVQLELGSTATDFEHRSYGEELALCQRYYQILVDGGADKAIGVGFYWSSNEVDYTHRFVTDMRASPTLEQVTGTDYYRMSANNDSFNGFSGIQYTSTRSCNMYASSNVSGTAGFASDIRSRNAESFIAFTAEL